MKKSLFIFGLLFLSIFSFAQVEFTTSGTYTVPAGVTEINVEIVGVGGKGGSNGGGGGGGGGYSFGTFTVTPASTYAITVGQVSGNVTSVSALSIQATSGGNGSGSAGGNGGYGTGGSINRTGGKGGAPEPYYYGGGGGGAAGSVGNGGIGGYPGAPNPPNYQNAGGAGGTGGGYPAGNGGKGAGAADPNWNAEDPATPGANYGGGGGGGNGNSSPASNGAPGIVRISIGGDPVTSVSVTTQGGVPSVITTASGTLQMVATVLPATATQLVTWSVTLGTGNATIDQTGLVTAVGNGTVWAKATSMQNSSMRDSLLITISNQPEFLPWLETFESGSGLWQTTTNGSHTSKWAVGTATSNPSGGNSLYISNDNGVTNAYTNTNPTVVHAYHKVLFPSTTNNFTLKFDWKCLGEGFSSTNYDYFRVWLVPETYTPTGSASTQIAAGTGRVQIGGNYNNKTAWQTVTTELDASTFANKSYRIVFEWRQDNGGGSGPAAIDNVSIKEIACGQPKNLVASNLDDVSATISWTAVGSASEGYDYYLSTTPGTPGTPTGVATGATFNLTGLTSNTQYYYWVRSKCGALNGVSDWSAQGDFKTIISPAVVPWTEDFATYGANWTLSRSTSNGSDVNNRWFFGNATGSTIDNGGNSATPSLYITNASASSSSYTNANALTTLSQTLYTWAVRDVKFPAGTNDFVVKYDWKSDGYDGNYGGSVKNCYFSVWLVPTTFTPTYQKITTGNSGGVLISGPKYLSPSTWTREEFTLPNASYAGGTYRLIFEFYKDANIFNNPQKTILPPPAIDNIKITEKCPITLTTDVQVCSGEQALLEVTSATAGVTFNWYTASTGGTAFHTGASYQTPAINFPFATTLYVSSTLGTCEGERKAISATAKQIPTVSTANIVNVCGTTYPALTATSPMPGAVFNWYDSPTNGATPVYTGASYTISSSAVSTYYVSATVSDCVSPLETVNLTFGTQPMGDGITVTDNTNDNFTFGLINPVDANTYKWNFGDGSPEVTTTSDAPQTHQYSGALGTVYTVTATLINGSCELVLTSNSITLPVQMGQLVGELNSKGHAALTWHTFMERNNKGFQIEKSFDGKQFDAIDFVSSKYEDGNGSQKIAYNYMEKYPLTKTAYFRLVQTDQDNKTSVSNIVQITKGEKTAFTIKAYPNPVENSVRISIKGERSENSYLIITDVLGNELSRMAVSTDEVELNMATYSSGIYLIKYMDSNNVSVLRVNKK